MLNKKQNIGIFLLVILLIFIGGCIGKENQKNSEEIFNGNIKEIIDTEEGYIFIERNISCPITYNEILDLQEKIMKKFAEHYNIPIMRLEIPEMKDDKIIAYGYRIYPEGKVKIYLGKIRNMENAKMVYETAEIWYETNIQNTLMSNNSKTTQLEFKDRQDKNVRAGKEFERSKIMDGELSYTISTDESFINIKERIEIFFGGITCGYHLDNNSWRLHFGKCEDTNGFNLTTFKIKNYILLNDTEQEKFEKFITVTHKYNNISIFDIWDRHPSGSYTNFSYKINDYSKSKIPKWELSSYDKNINIETESISALDISLSKDIGEITTKVEYEKCALGILCSKSLRDEILWKVSIPQSLNFSNFAQTETQTSNVPVEVVANASAYTR